MKNTKVISTDEIRTLLGEAEEHLVKSEFDQTEKIAKQVLMSVEKRKTFPKIYEAIALYIIGKCYEKTDRYSDALTHFNYALNAAESESDLSLHSKIFSGIASVQNFLGNYSTSIETAERALDLGERIDDKQLQSIPLSIIGLNYWLCGDYSTALEHYSRALALADEIGDKNRQSANLGDISSVYSEIGDRPRSMEYSLRALAIAKEIGDNYQIAVHLGNIGLEYIELGDNHSGEEYLQQALNLSQEIGALRPVGYWMLGLAAVQRNLGKLNSAYQGCLDTLYHRRNVLKTNAGVSDILYALGTVMMEQGKPSEALSWLEEALGLATEFGEMRMMAGSQKEIAEAYSQMGDMTSAFEHLKKHLELDKEIFSEESRKRIEMFNMRVAIAEKEGEKEIQRIKAEHFERELTTKALAYASQTELIAIFREDLRRIIRKIEARDPAINELIAKLRELPDGVDWKEFEEQFKQVHPEFRGNLLKKYPELTEIELRVAALLRLKLKTPDIARLLSLSDRTIDNHRHRIRKKLGLDGSVDFAKFLAAY